MITTKLLGAWISTPAAALLLMAALPVEGAILTFTGTISASGARDTPGIPSFSASFELLFDDSALTGVGHEIFAPLPLTHLSIDPDPFGVTSFSAANSMAGLEFENGFFSSLAIGGTAPGGGAYNAFYDKADDWNFQYASDQKPTVVYASVATEPWVYARWTRRSGANLEGFIIVPKSVSTIPEPGMGLASALIFIGLASMPGMKALRRKN